MKYIVMGNPHLPGTELPDPNGGDYYFVDGCGYSGKVIFVPRPSPGVPGNPAAPPPVDPAALAAQAEKQLPLPNPHIHMNPDPATGADQLAGLTTWLWVDSGDLNARSDSVTAGPVVVTATATATQVLWNMGDGHAIACVGAGTAYAPGASPTCSYTYMRSSSSQPHEAYKITATVTWTVSYTVTGAPGGGTLPAITRTSSTAVRVAEEQALNTPG